MKRRSFVHCSACASLTWVFGCGDDAAPPADSGGVDAGSDVGLDAPVDVGLDAATCPDPFTETTFVDVVPFVGAAGPFHVRTGQGWDGRLLSDLSLIPEREVMTNEDFYLRTFDPDLLDRSAPWSVEVSGLATPRMLSLDDLIASGVRDMGVHVLECSGNGPPTFGLMSAGRWGGVLVSDVLDALEIGADATALEVIGYDEHSVPSVGGHSTPGASWIFTFDQLRDAGAFFATEMNGMPLPNDHGAPVRLYVPGWYGCTCIKWVTGLRFVDATEPSSSQMREFASRTHQPGVPNLAADFLPATMDQAAMPVRIEKHRIDGAVAYRVLGILWGGYEPAREIVFSWGFDDFAMVEPCPVQMTNATWTVWQLDWRPAATGDYSLRMRLEDDTIPTRRLDTAYYARSVTIDEV